MPAITWPLTFVVKKYIPAIYSAWLLYIVSLTWWAVNIGVGVLWAIGAVKYDSVGGTNTLFTQNGIWTLFGVFMGYAVATNAVYYYVFHKGASHPDVDVDELEDHVNNQLVPDFFGF